jgi:hypothetical protein
MIKDESNRIDFSRVLNIIGFLVMGKLVRGKSVMQLLQNPPLFEGTSFTLLISLERQIQCCAKARLRKTVAKMFVQHYILCEHQKIPRIMHP